ncbi:hypothetical protein INT45_006733, partial [Circinella minor]
SVTILGSEVMSTRIDRGTTVNSKLAQDKDKLDRWDEFTGSGLMALRTMPNDSTRHTPAMLLYGQEIRTPSIWPAPRQDYIEGELNVEVARHVETIKKVIHTLRKDAKDRSLQERKRHKKYYDRFVHPRKKFAVGEQVLMKDQHPQSKFHPKWLGPMTVTKATDYGVYYLAGPNSRKIQGAVNGDVLIPYYQHSRMIPDVQVKRAEQQFRAWIERTED